MQRVNLNKVYRNFLMIQYFVYKVVGLSPWTLKASIILNQNRIDQNQNSVTKISYIGSAYNLLLILAYVSDHFYVKFFPDVRFVAFILNPVYKMVIEVTGFIRLVSIFWILIFYVYAQKSMIKITDQMISINQKLNITTDLYSKDFSSYFIFVLNFLVSVVKILIVLPYSSVEFVLFKNFSDIIFSWIIIQFTLLLRIVGKQFEIFNLSIKNLGNLESDVGQISLNDEPACQKIDNLKKIYFELCEVSDKINDLYGLPILMSLLHFGFEFVHNWHLIFITPLPDEIGLLLFYIADGIIAPWGIFLFLVLTSSVSKTTGQNKKTGQIVSLISNRRPINPKAKEQLIKFSKDLSHFNAGFSACGTLPLNRDLLGIACGTIATFLVIIVQGVNVDQKPLHGPDEYEL